MNDDAYLEVLYKSNLQTIKQLCNADKHMKELCKKNGNSIIKNLFKRFGSGTYGWKIGDGYNYFKGFEGEYVNIYRELLKYFEKSKSKHSFEYFLYYPISPAILNEFSDITRSFLQKNIKSYNLKNLGLKTLPEEYFCNLRVLNCSGNSLKELPDSKYLLNLTKLECENNEIVEIPNYTNLIKLSCENNRLKELPVLNKLKSLNCAFNNLKKIESYPELESLNCNRNEINKIEFSSKLVDIDCSNNNLTDLPRNLLYLRELRCFNNQLTEIHNYPVLFELDCPTNPITKIIGGPELRTIDCAGCKLSSLDSFLKVNFLDCSNNNIEIFDEPFPELLHLDINGNRLKELKSNNVPKLSTLKIDENVPLNLEHFRNLYKINGIKVEEILDHHLDVNSEDDYQDSF